MNQTGRLKRTATHETLHGLLALEAGFRIIEIRLVPQGQVIARPPFPPWSLARRFFEYPGSTVCAVKLIAAACIGPAVILGHEVAGDDIALMHEWSFAWEKARIVCAPAGPTWQSVAILAETLMQRSRVSGTTWAALVARQVHQQTVRATLNSLRPENVPCLESSWRHYARAGQVLVA